MLDLSEWNHEWKDILTGSVQCPENLHQDPDREKGCLQFRTREPSIGSQTSLARKRRHSSRSDSFDSFWKATVGRQDTGALQYCCRCYHSYGSSIAWGIVLRDRRARKCGTWELYSESINGRKGVAETKQLPVPGIGP